MGRLCATVLVMETVVIWLAIPVALTVDHARPGQAGIAGVVLAVAAVALAALARRHLRWTVIGGSVLQALVIAAGVIVPVMYFLGAIFAALWVIGILLGRRVAAASAAQPTLKDGTALDAGTAREDTAREDTAREDTAREDTAREGTSGPTAQPGAAAGQAGGARRS